MVKLGGPSNSAPPQLSISAATPVVRGYLTDMDCRWNIVSGSVDDRTEEERGLKVVTSSLSCSLGVCAITVHQISRFMSLK